MAVKPLCLLLAMAGLSLTMADPILALPPENGLITQQPQSLSQPHQILYVSATTGNDGGQGTQQSPLRTITRALQLAQSNTAIILAPGTYNEQTGEQFPLRLRSNVTIQGNPNTKGRDIIIYGGGFYTSRTSAKQNITILGANGARLSGVTVTNPYDRGYGLWIESTSLIVSQNTFTGNTHDGISVVGMGAPLIQDNIFQDNGANGITVYGSSRPEIRENEFQNTGFGINIAQKATPFIVGNRIIYNKDGVVIQAQARPILRDNYIERNQRDGIVAIAQASADLGNAQEAGRNVIQNNGRYDVHNGTQGQRILAYGNQLSQGQIAGRVESGGNTGHSGTLTQQLTASSTPTGNLSPTHGSRRSPINVTANLPVFTPDQNTPSVPTPQPVTSAPITPEPVSLPQPEPLVSVPRTRQPATATPIIVPLPESRQARVPVQPTASPSLQQYNSVRPSIPPTASPNSSQPNLLSRLRSGSTNAITIPVPAPESRQPATPNYQTSSVISSGLLPVPQGQIPVSNQGYLPTGLEANSTSTASLTPITTALLGLRYRVVVEDTSEPIYQRVRQFVPEAFRTVVKNRSVIQVGAFRDRSQANRILRQLNQNQIPAKIEPFN